MFNIDPFGTVKYKSIDVPTILCHYDSYGLGLGSGHGDIYNWFPKFGKNMENVRQDVANILNNGEDEEDMMSQERFNELMEGYLAELAQKEPSDWSAADRDWCEANGIIQGDGKSKMYKKFLTREEMAALIHRVYNLIEGK